MNTNTQYAGSRAAWAGLVHSNALDGIRAFTGRCAVSPAQAPATGAVRPQAGNNVLMVKLFADTDKGDVCVRSSDPPI